MGPAVSERPVADRSRLHRGGARGGRKVGARRQAARGPGARLLRRADDLRFRRCRRCRIFKEEVFGPVLSVATAESLARGAGVRQRCRVRALTTSIFTQDIDAALRFVEDAEIGMVHVNEPTVGGEAQLPFGGTQVHRRRRARDGRGRVELLHRLEDGVHQLWAERQAPLNAVSR